MVQLGKHQLDAIEQLDNGKILKGGVGSGKSRTSLAYFLGRECDASYPVNGVGDFGTVRNGKDLYILTTAKKRDSTDWLSEAIDFRLTTSRENSYGYIQVTVDSWNNIAAYKEVKNAFFIFDEQRLVGSGAWVKAFLKIAQNNRWIVLSATPGDTWIEYAPVFIANGFYKNRTEFIQRHVVYSPFTKFPKILRYVDTDRLELLRRRITVDMELYRHTKRVIRNVLCEYDKKAYERVTKDRWNIYEGRPVKESGELLHLMRRVVNTDPSRLIKLKEIMDRHPRLIVFYNFNYELDILREFLDGVGITYAEWNGQRHQDVPTTDSWVYLVQYTAGSEAWECTSTDAMAFYSLNYSYKINEQCQGRTDRMNTKYTDLYYYYLRSVSSIDQGIQKALVTKKNFNEKKFSQNLLLP